MKRVLFITWCLILGMSYIAKADNYRDLNISSPDIKQKNDSLFVRFMVKPSDFKLKTSGIVRIVPVLKNTEGSDSIELQPLAIAGKNAWYGIIRNNGMQEEPFTFKVSSQEKCQYESAVAWKSWMENSVVTLRKISECCGEISTEWDNYDFATLDYAPRQFKETKLDMVVPVDNGPKTRNVSGKAYVNFPVNRTEIFPDYMNNPAELKKILNSIDEVKNNKDVTVNSISLTGYASPEGPWKNNVRLAAGRTEAVKEYVRKMYTFPKNIYHTNSVPEDWQGLRDYVATSALPDRDAILSLIDDKSIPEEDRNDVLRSRFPIAYESLLKNIYPSLRHTDYLISYVVRDYTDVEEIKRVLKSAPGQLSLNELYQAAVSYGEGTPEYDEVFEVAVRLYPDDPVANLNAASTAIRKSDYERATSLLSKAGDSGHANYTRGVLEALKGNLSEAENYFKKAESQGMDVRKALDNLKLLSDKDTDKVKFAK